MVLSNKSMPVPPRINMLYPSSMLKPFTMAKDTLCLCFGLIVMLVYQTYYSSLAQFKTLERRLSKDPELRERYADTTREDIRKGYIVIVEPHDPRKRYSANLNILETRKKWNR